MPHLGGVIFDFIRLIYRLAPIITKITRFATVLVVLRIKAHLTSPGYGGT